LFAEKKGNEKMRLLTGLFLSLICFSSCTVQQKPSPAGAMVELISGTSVWVYPVETVSFVNDLLPSSLLLRYETTLELVDSGALREEVGEVWLVLQPKADSSGCPYAMIKAAKAGKGWGARSASFTYGFSKIKQGVWKMREPAM
jgi:hypothetical protein